MLMFEKGQLMWVNKEREGERKTERWHSKQKRVKWVRVADESEREREREREGERERERKRAREEIKEVNMAARREK